MKRNNRQVLIAVCLFAVSGVGVASAQQTDERERRRLLEVEERAQQAQQELQRALDLIAEEESDEARRRMQRAIRELQRATSQLHGEIVITGYASPGNLFVRTGRREAPQMGVFLNMEQRPSADSIGVVLNRVAVDGPAYEAGLRDGDIITEANGESLAREGRHGTSPANKLITIKDDLEEGDTLHVQYRRGATTHAADIEVRYLENSFAVTWDDYTGAVKVPSPRVALFDRNPSGFNVATVFPGHLSRLGILDVELLELDEELGWYFGVEEGLLVVRAPGEDDLLDLRSGDVILSIDGREPRSESQLMRILGSYAEGEDMEISLMRQREAMTIETTVPERDHDGFSWKPSRY